LLSLPLLLSTLSFVVHSQSFPQTPSAPDKPKESSEEGIPVTNQLVIDKCSTCHKRDDKGRLTRISYERLTPEGWQQAIKRMVRLNGPTLS
jgi:quinohemoprotein amine dehydrogenase